jgi:hypothetical protein
MADNKIIARIERELGVTGLVDLLAERLNPSDLQSLLIEVYRQRVQQQDPAALLRSQSDNRFLRPSTVSPQRLNAWEAAAFASLPPEFEALALSPVAPLGASSVIATVDQNRVLATTRNSEVLSDSTNVLALECALRRRDLLREDPKSAQAVHLAASHRLLRAQYYGDNPHLVTHFSAFALCSAGRTLGGLRFELAALGLHIGVYVRALRRYLGEAVTLRLALTDFNAADRQPILAEYLLEPLQAEFPDLDCGMDEQRTGGEGYYDDLCFHLYGADSAGNWLELADGGVVDWPQRVLSNAKERCVISGIGSERVCSAFASEDG